MGQCWPHQPYASSSSSKSHRNNLTSFVVASLEVAHTLCQRASDCAQPSRLVSLLATAQGWVQKLLTAPSLPGTDLHIGSGKCLHPLHFQGMTLFMKLFAVPKPLVAVCLLLSHCLFLAFYSPLAVCLFK